MMWFHSPWRSRKHDAEQAPSRRDRRPAARRTRRALRVEPLEDRCLLTGYSIVQLPLNPMDINAHGQVVGYVPDSANVYSGRAALWQDGTLIDLGSLAGPAGKSRATAINDAGQVVGDTQLPPGGLEAGAAFLITPEDTDQDGSPDRWFRDDNQDGINDLMTALDAIGGHSDAYDINAAGKVVGTSGYRAVLWQNGNLIDLGSLTGAPVGLSNGAFGINDAGQVVGRSGDYASAFLLNPEDTNSDGAPDRWYRDTDNDGGNDLMVGLGPLGVSSAAINATGQVVAGGFLWTPDEPNGTTGGLCGLGFVAADINATGEVVGTLEIDRYYAESTEGDLEAMIPPDRAWAWLSSAVAINDSGRIVGWGSAGGYLLVPTGEPTPPRLSIGYADVVEGNSGTRAATFTVTLSAAYTQPVTVDFATLYPSSDYVATSGTLTFASGETSKIITVLVNGDRLAEPNETFYVNLSNATNAYIDDDMGEGTILDDEPRISISDVTKSEGKKGQTTLFTFTVTLSATYDQTVTMSFQTVNGTATTRNNDYVAKSGTITFLPGDTTKTITIEVKGDSKKESNETFYLDLFGNSSNSLITKSRGIGTILNDD